MKTHSRNGTLDSGFYCDLCRRNVWFRGTGYADYMVNLTRAEVEHDLKYHLDRESQPMFRSPGIIRRIEKGTGMREVSQLVPISQEETTT